MGKEAVLVSNYEDYLSHRVEGDTSRELRLYLEARKACSQQIDSIRQILERLKPSPPYRSYAAPFLIEGNFVYHSDVCSNIVETLRKLREIEGSFSTSQETVIVSSPGASVPKPTVELTPVITTNAVEVLPLKDDRVQLYVHTDKLVEALSSIPSVSCEMISFLIAEATGESLPLVGGVMVFEQK